MNFFTDSDVERALSDFDAIEVEQTNQANRFFSIFGPGNRSDATDRPYERFCDYETLLTLLSERCRQKYDQVHKGTPFYFLAWLAFDFRNYDKFLYYLDAAISEDVKNAGLEWINLPGACFLKLTPQSHAAERSNRQIRTLLIEQLDRFNDISNQSAVSVDSFIDGFVVPLMLDPSTRTILSALYIFLLEYQERKKELSLRSTEGTSLGPIITHLFSGGLIFESLLKNLYPTKNNGNQNKTLGDIIFHTTPFESDFGTGFRTSADTLQEILDDAINDSLLTAFCTTSRIRNTTGHNLVWDNIFNTSEKYENLSTQIINAIFYVIEKKFLR